MADKAQSEATLADPLDGFLPFARAVRKRLLAGRAEYGDRSFQSDPVELLAEVAEELLDVAGWAFIAWTRVQELALKADAATRRARELEGDRVECPDPRRPSR